MPQQTRAVQSEQFGDFHINFSDFLFKFSHSANFGHFSIEIGDFLAKLDSFSFLIKFGKLFLKFGVCDFLV